MSARMHVHLKVRDLARSRNFYADFLGATPVKVRADQAKFQPPIAPVNLTLSVAHRGEKPGGFVNHLGIEVESREVVLSELARIEAAGIKARVQLNVNCCYANQTKFWVIDPDGVEWEVFHLNYDLIEKHGEIVAGATT